MARSNSRYNPIKFVWYHPNVGSCHSNSQMGTVFCSDHKQLCEQLISVLELAYRKKQIIKDIW